ncbi:MAG: dTDP-glucose 4,6-dehydratase [Candidatus Pacebacteria bacterium]|nr:dTDP-glucose 4,6-dehydratase [Candidatus Paceibacterota bacterium]
MKYKKIILVTGGAGSIGSNFLNRFVPKYKNYFFINLDILNYAANLDNIKVNKNKNYQFEKVDIRDIKKLEKVFNKYHPTDIIHFAAEVHVDFSIINPLIFVETNINGTHNLLILAKAYSINRFHQISTDEVYGQLYGKKGKFKESDNLNPNNPYSASKAAADLLVSAYHKTFNLETIITRSSNNYGPHQDKTKFIPKFITNLLDNKKVPLYGKGENIRDWIYIEDNIEAIDLVFHKGKSGEVYNIGGQCEKTNIEVTKILLKLLHKDESYIEYVSDRPGHDFRYALDTSKIYKELGWKPKYIFERGIKKTIEFYKKQK